MTINDPNTGKRLYWHMGTYPDVESAAIAADVAYITLGMQPVNFPEEHYADNPIMHDLGDIVRCGIACLRYTSVSTGCSPLHLSLPLHERRAALRKTMRLRLNNKSHPSSTQYAYIRRRACKVHPQPLSLKIFYTFLRVSSSCCVCTHFPHVCQPSGGQAAADAGLPSR